MLNCVKVVLYDKSFSLKDFDCGQQVLNKYLTNYASQDIKRYLASVFLGINSAIGKVIGYYTLSSNRIDISELEMEYTRKLPNYPYLPAILIGRLAIDKDYQRQKLGEYLLLDALNRAYQAEIAAFAVLVEVKNDQAINFIKATDLYNLLIIPTSFFYQLIRLLKYLFKTQDSLKFFKDRSM